MEGHAGRAGQDGLYPSIRRGLVEKAAGVKTRGASLLKSSRHPHRQHRVHIGPSSPEPAAGPANQEDSRLVLS